MSSLTYTTYVDQIANLLVIGSTDANFQTMLPGMIDYAENRMYRELNLLAATIADNSNTLTANNRSVSLSTSNGNLIIENVNVITPATATSTSGTRIPLVNTTLDVLDAIWPSNAANTGVPRFWANLDNFTILVGPPPDAAYPLEIRGAQQNPTPLSSSNTTTILTEMLADCFIAASMVFGSAYQRDFSAQGDNPAQGMSWEQTYKTLVASADVVEIRKVYQSQGWGSDQPSNITSPPRV